MIWDILGWVVWALVAMFALAQWERSMKHTDGGIRIMSRGAAILLTIVLVGTIVTPIHKLHLLWMAPVVLVVSQVVVGFIFVSKLERKTNRILEEVRLTGDSLADVADRERIRSEVGAGYTVDERAAITEAFNKGDEEEGLRIIEAAKTRAEWQLREQGIEPTSVIGMIGEDFSWKDAIGQVFRVVRFEQGKTRLDSQGIPRTEKKTDPYGFLLVESPIFNVQFRLPIIHRDDFLLAAGAFEEPSVKDEIEGGELLVTYVPKKYMPNGMTMSTLHSLHYGVFPGGTIDRYYRYKGDWHMRMPNPEALFGPLVYEGEISVKVNPWPPF